MAELSEKQLLYTREQVALLLGRVSVATVIRLERAGRLHPVRLTPKPTAQVFYHAAQVVALTAGGLDATAS